MAAVAPIDGHGGLELSIREHCVIERPSDSTAIVRLPDGGHGLSGYRTITVASNHISFKLLPQAPSISNVRLAITFNNGAAIEFEHPLLQFEFPFGRMELARCTESPFPMNLSPAAPLALDILWTPPDTSDEGYGTYHLVRTQSESQLKLTRTIYSSNNQLGAARIHAFRFTMKDDCRIEFSKPNPMTCYRAARFMLPLLNMRELGLAGRATPIASCNYHLARLCSAGPLWTVQRVAELVRERADTFYGVVDKVDDKADLFYHLTRKQDFVWPDAADAKAVKGYKKEMAYQREIQLECAFASFECIPTSEVRLRIKEEIDALRREHDKTTFPGLDALVARCNAFLERCKQADIDADARIGMGRRGPHGGGGGGGGGGGSGKF